ncbi:MAG: hypothetical protein EBT63_06945 [Proteobacteria bacterium]|nr:hypothetical protein [Pseudomonadota bacterium]NCA29022.1 hypothetical protein [Pseudomonadota bacterium]
MSYLSKIISAGILVYSAFTVPLMRVQDTNPKGLKKADGLNSGFSIKSADIKSADIKPNQDLKYPEDDKNNKNDADSGINHENAVSLNFFLSHGALQIYRLCVSSITLGALSALILKSPLVLSQISLLTVNHVTAAAASALPQTNFKPKNISLQTYQNLDQIR